MSKLGFVYHPDFLKHDTGIGHPERPQRLEALVQHLLGTPLWSQLSHLRPEPAALEWVQAIHPEKYTSMIRSRCHVGEHVLDEGDTHVSKDSYEVALLATGGVLMAVDEVMTGRLDRAFCAVRPPGHHAGTSTVMGFCLFNNVAIGARYAQRKYDIKRVAIVDWDVHHGNGTQQIFYEDESVLYISLHQYPYYPGTGSTGERGAGLGEGFTVNCPMGAGSVEKDYLDAFQTHIHPALHSFQPELLFISAGFDAHKDDPLAGINLTEDSFAKMTNLLLEVTGEYCKGRIVSVLEGGYNLQALARSVTAHLNAMV
ncbi:MAG: histone deacetylase [Ignavibacteriales bacterium]|nr:histone deacetylase [Ignavibacteriales bacterium]